MTTKSSSKTAQIAQSGQFTLQIGRRHTCEVQSLAHASQVYSRLRDESGEGASTFPDGKITGAGAPLRVSYNGRIWHGEQAVQTIQDPKPAAERPAQSQPEELVPFPHELTRNEFIEAATIVKLENHGRVWEVRFGKYSAFSDAGDPISAKADVHRAAVNNALYMNDPENQALFNAAGCPSLPTDIVLQDYPQLQAMYAEVIAMAQDDLDYDTDRSQPARIKPS